MTDSTAPAAPHEHETKTSVAAAMDAVAAAISLARGELDAAVDDIARIDAEIYRTKSAPPHTDDIVASFTRGLDRQCEAFKEQLGRHLNSANALALDSAQIVKRDGHLLTLDRELQSGTRLIPSKPNANGDALSVAALAYFLRDKLAAEIPELVAEFCPGSTNGMRQADQEARLRELEAEREIAVAHQNELKTMLVEVQQSVWRKA